MVRAGAFFLGEKNEMKVKVTIPKPRNHAALAASARSGSHRKGEKSCRQQGKRELRRELRGF
jgi:hypothetical protein